MNQAAKFTRDNPCTKVHLWNCFRGPKGYQIVPVVTARGRIGDNAPKYLLRERYVRVFTDNDVEYYALTPEGEKWLDKGIRRHLELHIEDTCLLSYPIPGTAMKRTAVKPATRVIVRGRR